MALAPFYELACYIFKCKNYLKNTRHFQTLYTIATLCEMHLQRMRIHTYTYALWLYMQAASSTVIPIFKLPCELQCVLCVVLLPSLKIYTYLAKKEIKSLNCILLCNNKQSSRTCDKHKCR